MANAKRGDTVTVGYTAKLTDGRKVAETPAERGETITLGEGRLLKPVEEGLIGMAPGDTKTLNVPSNEAFGAYDPQRVFKVPRSDLPADIAPEIGARLQVRQQDGRTVAITVKGISDDSVELDANHPLADQDLVVDVKLLALQPA